MLTFVFFVNRDVIEENYLIIFKRIQCRRSHYIAAFLAALLIVVVQVFSKPEKTPVADEFIYLKITSDLITSGTYSDGPFAHNRDKIVSGRFFSPLYPGFLLLIAGMDENVSTAILCDDKRLKQNECSGNFQKIVAVQVFLAALSLLFIFIIAESLSSSFIVAWLAMCIAVATGEFGYFARTYLTENLAFFSFYGLLLFLVLGVMKHRAYLFLIAGLFAGFAILSRPSYAYLYYLLIPTLFVLLIWVKKLSPIQATKTAGMFAFGGIIVLAPWMIRNYMLFGDMAITRGYGEFILLQRLAYNSMSWPEWGVFFIWGLPDFGDGMSKMLFSQNLWERLDYYHKGVSTYYNIGNSSAWRNQLLPAAITNDQHLSHLIKTYILGDLFKHVMVTVPLALRGMWAGKYLALLGVAFAWPVGRLMMQKKHLTPYLLLLLPPLFMVGLHGFVSVNVVRYNVPMIAVYSVICAIFIRHLIYISPRLSSVALRLEGRLEPKRSK